MCNHNFAAGMDNLNQITSGSHNIAIGQTAGHSCGNSNIIIGNYAGYKNSWRVDSEVAEMKGKFEEMDITAEEMKVATDMYRTLIKDQMPNGTNSSGGSVVIGTNDTWYE